ncbi:hypothetical protein Gbem_1763 [Citrifermentans bemidjiense Bem]|uniref:Uncharacterized protein n=1 Tax=Citrifermentans bemidjiense (strain ATCC BAA-1014 / DSM 16622 / JCM 12645 / Bem) TaxID=404380 RepID=B5EA73_CITBB|nr:hypothetical protein [Citrifermentans bemidjiense]ACH38779.1 hypothetical protein Gbem_1763 [Citrifermentans bemidjiense Bem]
MKSAKYRSREEHVARRGTGWENGGAVISQQTMLLTDVMLASVEMKQSNAGLYVVDLSQEGVNIMKLACSVLRRQTALATSSKAAQVVFRQF